MGGKTQRSYRLDAGVVDALEAWAAEHGTTNTEAVETLLRAAMDADGRAEDGAGEPVERADGAQIVDVLKANIDDLRAQVSTLTEQVAAKDEQIRGLMGIADHAQALHAAAVKGYLDGGEKPRESREDDGEGAGAPQDEQDEQTAAEPAQTAQGRPAGFWERIKAALMGY